MAAAARTFVLCALAAFGVACGDFAGTSSGSTSAPQQLLSSAASAGGVDAFAQTLYPILVDNCAECHEGNGPGSPHIAHPSATTAYSNVVNQGKVDLADPPASRIVQKVGGGHHCWTPLVPVQGQTNCQTNMDVLTAAIAEWADIIDFGNGGVSINETLASSTQRLSDGVQDTQGERYAENLVAFYDFKEGQGDIIHDRIATDGRPINLQLTGDYSWMSSWGVQFNDARAVSTHNEFKLTRDIASPAGGTGQYTVEYWATNANIVQDGPARIVTYSRDSGSSNFMIGQNAYNFVFRNRALLADMDGNGNPALETYDADEDAQDRLQHVVVTYDQYRGRRIYVDGRWTDDVDVQGPGRLWNWDTNAAYKLAFGNVPSSEDRHWEGQLRLVAIYDTALTDAQIIQNYQAGVGRRLLMRFDISPWTEPGSAIEYIVSEFDDYSYMFCNPVYKTTNPSEFRLSNIRIAVNGEVATTGQGFSTLDTQITGSQQVLSEQCAVIPKGPGSDPATDDFTLVFEHLNGFENPIVDDPAGQVTVRMDATPRPERGLRDFARINQTMASVTGVDPLTPAVDATFDEIQQQLPSGFDLRTFVSSQQVGIAKLALEYCDQLVEADVLLPPAQRYFGAFPMTSVPETAFASATDRNLLFDTLYDRMVGAGLQEQPTRQGVRDDLNTLVDTLMLECTPGSPCNTTRTLTTMKGVCAAVLSSAAMTIH
jgi:hypothetical protein